MSLIGVVVGSALAVLESPRWLFLALAGFLVRGGLLLLLLPIVIIPTTAAVANLLGPTLVGFVFGGVSPGFLLFAGSIVVGLAAWLILGGLAGAAIDLELIRATAAAEDLEAFDRPDRGGPGRAVIARWLAHIPTAAVVVGGAAPLVTATYQELIHPGDPGLSVPERVLLRVPYLVVGLVAAWVVGEVVGGLAVRHLAWGSGLPRAMLRAIGSVLRPSGLVVLVLTDAAVLAGVALGWIALALAYDQVRAGVRDGLGPIGPLVGLVLLSVAWLGALWLVGLATAWRSAAWTFELGRRAGPRTIEPSGT
jgi:hypothetical protein